MKNLNWARAESCSFTLIEFLIYLLLFSFAYSLFFSVSNKSLLNILSISRNQNRELELALAVDILRRDLLSASMLEQDWMDALFIFKKQGLSLKNKDLSTSVCWYIGRLGLMRAEGQFEFAQKKWQSKAVSLVCKDISKIEARLQKDPKLGSVCGVRVIFSAGKDSILGKKSEEQAIFVRPRNRLLR
jgi:type II secretory pathway component PulJ